MKGLYISNLDPYKSTGYLPKILGQILGFSRLGLEIDLLSFDADFTPTLRTCDRYSQGSSSLGFYGKSGSNLVLRRWYLLKSILRYVESESPSFLYFRYPRAEPLYLYFLSRLRRQFPALIILSEFPTYPYDQEYDGSLPVKDRLMCSLDNVTRNYLKYFIDRIVSINYNQPILGINTISIDNGIDASEYRAVRCRVSSDGSINLIGVANVNEWHGYDRIIRGLGKYYRNAESVISPVKFKIVGAVSPYLDTLVALAAEENVSQFVSFFEPMQGKWLDLLFEGCSLAVGVLGGHRKGLKIMSPLKNREYCARGVPFVFSHVDPDFSDGFRYCLNIDSDDSPVNIPKLLSFISDLERFRDVTSEMRKYAHKNLDWSIKLSPVANYLQEKTNLLSVNKL